MFRQLVTSLGDILEKDKKDKIEYYLEKFLEEKLRRDHGVANLTFANNQPFR